MSQTQLIGGQENLQIPVIVRQSNEVADDGLFVILKYTAELPILARMELLQWSASQGGNWVPSGSYVFLQVLGVSQVIIRSNTPNGAVDPRLTASSRPA